MVMKTIQKNKRKMREKMAGGHELLACGGASSCNAVSCISTQWSHGYKLIYIADNFLAEMLESQAIAPKARRRLRDGAISPELEVQRLAEQVNDVNGNAIVDDGMSGKKNVDDLLPVGVSYSILTRML